MAETTKLHLATVTIDYVQESVTKGGLRRFLIGATRAETTPVDPLADRVLSFTTLNQWKAALCDQAQKSGATLLVKYRLTRYFDADLLHVELLKDAVSA